MVGLINIMGLMHIVLLTKIYAIINSDFLEKVWITKLREYISSFKTIVLNELEGKWVCKNHNLEHYPDVLLNHASARQYDTMRFEQKHQTMTQFLKRNKCYKNPCLTMVKKHSELFWSLNYPSNVIRENDFTDKLPIDYFSIDERHRIGLLSNYIPSKNYFTYKSHYKNSIHIQKNYCYPIKSKFITRPKFCVHSRNLFI